MGVAPRTVVTEISLQDEEAIIRKAQADITLFRPIYERYFRMVFNFVFHRVGDKELTADITQQVFFKALTNLNKYQFKGLPFSSWLFRVAINECNELFRNKKRTRFIVLGENPVEDLYNELIPDNDQEELERRLPDILQRLHPEELSLIELRFFEKRPFKEIAGIMGVTEINAKTRTYRILGKMKNLFLS